MKKGEFKSKVIRWGNSQAVSLPKEIAEKLNLKFGDVLDIEIGDSGEIIISNPYDLFFGAADVSPKKSGLSVSVRSLHRGVNFIDCPQVELSDNDIIARISLERNPKILKYYSERYKDSDVKEAIGYVGRNYDIFLKHFLDTDDSFIDDDLFDTLSERGEYGDE